MPSDVVVNWSGLNRLYSANKNVPHRCCPGETHGWLNSVRHSNKRWEMGQISYVKSGMKTIERPILRGVAERWRAVWRGLVR